MKPLTELITAWDTYESKAEHPSVADFCGKYLQKYTTRKAPPETEVASEDADGIVAALVGRLGAMHTTYAKMLIRELPGVELEWFYLLNIINYKKGARKTDIISLALMEQSTGIDMLNRMKKRGLITEKTDPADKRARQVSITAKGRTLLVEIGRRLFKAPFLLYHGLKPGDKQTLIRLLSDISGTHEHMLQDSRHLSADEMMQQLYGEDAPAIALSAFRKLAKKQEKHLRESDKSIDEIIRSLYK
ncbi:MAG TPA: MarR family transcriptional regulator [Chitinophaga sp.]|uniref:MarR family winged helix-turn-helix transcriptional regulator n=1 Tax=Chitinophaga sp. TaxID=1869181 RepID=UPI002BD09B16|nr:MarR family transcriptional regulator [Chitinophaga sp.]HVI44799.1 MarR family transcriptional regulator [Chitinophaga sp.]